MKQKPSERIKEIYNSKTRIFTADNDERIQTEDWLESLLEYLDEEYERNKPCEHKDSYQVDGNGEVFYNVCNDCGVLFLASEDKS